MKKEVEEWMREILNCSKELFDSRTNLYNMIEAMWQINRDKEIKMRIGNTCVYAEIINKDSEVFYYKDMSELEALTQALIYVYDNTKE